MHCPGKKGVDVSRILEKQLSRLGLNPFDVIAGTGDGGGENEGHSGVHAYFENLNPGYVRRRCLPHIAWRTCDVAIRASALQYKALAAYLVEGITWKRLQELATQAPADGGLGLFAMMSQEYQRVFSTAPCSIIENRPETDLNLLRFLSDKEHILHLLAQRDLEQRSLNQDVRDAVLLLGDIGARVQRRILQEILERCMYLHYWTNKHKSVVSETSWDELLGFAVKLILDLQITPRVLEHFNMTQADLDAWETPPRSWVCLAVYQVVGQEDLVSERLEEALEFHRKVSEQAGAHLNLVGDNTFRTPWLACKLLNTQPRVARDAAACLLKHLDTTRPANRTSFEQALVERPEVMSCLEEFSSAEPPVLLWRANGKYETLFKFIAPRFLLSPDHVLDAERIHARWQWILWNKRNLRLPGMNALLKLRCYLESNQGFPGPDELDPHLLAEHAEHRAALRAVQDEEHVALGYRTSYTYLQRFNLGGHRPDILIGPAPAPVVPGSPFVIAWRNYIKTVFQKGFLYRLSCKPDVVLYIAENKTLAGKEDRTYEGEATGRKLAVVFFEDMHGDLVRRVDRENMVMKQQLLSIAEILQTLNCIALPADPARTSADTEILLERHYQDLEIQRFTPSVEPAAGEVHVYHLHHEVHAEMALCRDLKADTRTKMVLARCLQRNDDLEDNESLQDAWSKSLAVLKARAAPHLPVPPAAPAPAAPAPAAPAGRGRGRGRGRAPAPAAPAGRGRGRAAGRGR